MATQHNICVCATTLCSNIVPLLPNQNLPIITVYFADKQLTALIDTGAQVPLIDYDICQTFLAQEPPPVQFTNKTVPAVACNGTQLTIEGTVKGAFRFHEHDNTPLYVEFYLLRNSAQQCLFPHPWLKLLKCIIDYNTLSVKVNAEPGSFLSAEGKLSHDNLHKQQFWKKAADNSLLAGLYDHDDCDNNDKDDDEDDGGDDHDDDDDDAEDPLLIVDNDNHGENHHEEHDEDHDEGQMHKSEHQDATISMTACQSPSPAHQVKSHPSSSITIQPKSAFSRLITRSDRKTNRNIRPGFFHHNDSLTMSVWKKHSDKLILRLFNDSDHPISVQLSQLRFHKPRRSVRILPVDLKKWVVNNSPTPSPKGANESLSNANVNIGSNNGTIDTALHQLQSSFCHYSKNLDNLSLSSEKIPFSIPADFKKHPFGQDTSPLTLLHVYLIHIIGSNFKLTLKSKDELKQMIASSGLFAHQRALALMERLFQKGRVQEMYSKLSLYIVTLVHLAFLDCQRNQHSLEKISRPNIRIKRIQSLHKKLVSTIKSIAALYFLNQKLINYFFNTTLQHPFFQQLRLPLSFNQTLIKLGLTNDEQASPNDDEQTPHTITTDKDNYPHVDDDDADQIDGDIPRSNTHDDHHHSHKDSHEHDDHNDDHSLVPNYDHEDSSQDGDDGGDVLSANSLNLHPPSTLPNKLSLTQLVTQSAPSYTPKQLTFRQFSDQIHQACNEISKTQETEYRKSPYSGKQVNLSQLSPQEIQSFIQYSKSPRRLVDFIEDQVPSLQQAQSPSSVADLLESIPLPQWVIYQNENEILDDYIPTCLRKDFDTFFSHLSDPVFIKYSSLFPLPYPPTQALLQLDPPDPLHSPSGLVDPKVLASICSQFLTADHPLITNPIFYLELLHLACILYSFGNFNVSLHAYDTGLFRQEFRVQTLLAPTAPTSSTPSKAATEHTDQDLDERLELLIQQGKCQTILGSPFLNQIQSVPKKFKSGQIIHSSKSDPILAYIDSLSDQCKNQLATKSNEITSHQKSLIQLLNNPELPVSPQEPSPQVEPTVAPLTPLVDSSHPIIAASVTAVPFGELLQSAIIRLQIYDLSPKVGKLKTLQFESSSPPTPPQISSFTQHIVHQNKSRILNSKGQKSKKTKGKRIKFGFVFIAHITNTDTDVFDRLSHINSIRFRNNYFASPEHGALHERKYCKAAIGTYSQKLVGNVSLPTREEKHNVQFLMNYSPNIGQLARNKLNLNLAQKQQFLANANTINFCIEQISTGSLFNLIGEDDEHYLSMKKLASDPRFLQQAHTASSSNQNNSNLVKFCYNVTVHKSKQTPNFEQMKCFGKIQIPKQDSQYFPGFINNIITVMRRLDHRQPLKAAFQLKKNVLDVISTLDPNFDPHSPISDYNNLTLQQMCEKYGGACSNSSATPTDNSPVDQWAPFLDKVANHYQLPAIWLFVEVTHSGRYKQDIIIYHILFSNLCLFSDTQKDFIISPINPTSGESYKIRTDPQFCRRVLQTALQNEWPNNLQLSELILRLQGQCDLNPAHPDQNNFGNSSQPKLNFDQETTKPRFSKIHYKHIGKSFYHKNTIHRIIQASKDSNKLIRPISSRAVQSQSNILKNLGASELFSSFDLTSAYDALPADAISSLTNTASYRNQEYAFLIASQGGSNSCLYMQRAVCSLMHRIKDEILLKDCFLPNSISSMEPMLQSKFLQEDANSSRHDANNPSHDVQQSWLCRPHLHLAGPLLLKKAQKLLFSAPRRTSKQHILPLNQDQRKALLAENKEDNLISSTALLDDLITSSKSVNSKQYRLLSDIEKLRIQFKIHTFILLSIFSAINTLSAQPGAHPPFQSSLKLRLEKSVFAATSLRYLNIVYLRGHRAIDLQNFKKSIIHISELPTTGDQLRSALGFYAFLINFVPNLRYHLKSLNSLADLHPAKKSINWNKYPKLEAIYHNLCKVVQNNTALHTLPDDLCQISKFILNADACNQSLSYLVGFVLALEAIATSSRRQDIRPFKFYSAKLPDYALNLTILLKEIFASVFAILDNLPQIRLLPPSVEKYLILDSKPLYSLLTKLQNNGSLDNFFTSHPQIPLWLNRLHQLVTQNEIRILLMPTKNSPPADFITRPKNTDPQINTVDEKSSSCLSFATTKRVNCQLCPACQACCIRKTSHSKCPFAVSGAPDVEPNLLCTNKSVEKSVVVDETELRFKDNQIQIDWDKLEEVSLKPILANSCYKQYLQNISEHDLTELSTDAFDFQSMLQHSEFNLEQLKQAQNSLSELYNQISQYNNDESPNHDVAPNAQHDAIRSKHDVVQNDHDNGQDDNVTQHNVSIINNVSHDDKIESHDDGDPCQHSVQQTHSASSYENRLFCNQSNNHRCYQPNFCVLTEYFLRTPHTFRFSLNSSVVVFVTQKKRWNLLVSYFFSSLKDTAAANLIFHPGQLQRLVVDGADFLILCVGADVQEQNTLQISSLIPNLNKCSSAASTRHIYYDANSIMMSYQCKPENVVEAIKLIARSHPAHHCAVFNSHNKITKFSLQSRPLCLHLPLLHNGTRRQLLTLELDPSPHFSTLSTNFRNQILEKVSRLPPLSRGQERKIAVVNLSGDITDLLDPSTPLNLSNLSSVLVKDYQIIKCVRGEDFVAYINLLQSSNNPSVTQQILKKTGKIFPTIRIHLKTPLKHEFYPALVSLEKGHCLAIFDGHSLSLSQLRQLCDIYPEISQIYLSSHFQKSKLSPQNNSINVAQLAESSGDLLCHFLGEYTNLYLSQTNNHLTQRILRSIQNSEEKQIVEKNVLFKVFDDILYAKTLHKHEDKDNNQNFFKPVLPDDRLIPLILKIHSQNCSPPKRVVRKIRQTFFHAFGLTSNMSIEKITSTLLPCYKCLVMRPAYMTTALNVKFKSIALQAQGKRMCSMAALDVFYLADATSKIYSNNFISFIVCLSCKFMHLRPISRVTSYALAQHILEYIRLTGRTPSVIVSDAATTNLFGQMQMLLKDLHLIHIKANQQILNNNSVNDPDIHDKDNDDDGDNDDDDDDGDNKIDSQNSRDSFTPAPPPPPIPSSTDKNSNKNTSIDKNVDKRPTSSPPPYSDVPLQLLSPAQKKFLLQDLNTSDPPLYPPVLRHCPVSYKPTQMHKQTSLGSLDNACRRLQIFLKKNLTCLPNNKDFKNQIEFLVSSFEYQNNFCLEAEVTQTIPAFLHLGSIRTANVLNFMENIRNLEQPSSQHIIKMQEILHNSRKILEAGQNTLEKVSSQQARQLKEHGRLKKEGDIIQQIQPLDVLFVKTELQNKPKMSFFVSFHGPMVVLAVQPKNEHLVLFGLLSGEILVKNYKQVRFAFSKEIFSLPIYPYTGDIQFRMFTPLMKMSKQDTAQNVFSNTTKLILNIHKISSFLAPLLPSYSNSQDHMRTITLSIIADDPTIVADDPNIVADDPNIVADDPNIVADDDHQEKSGDLVDLYVKPSVSFDPSTKTGPDDNDDDDGGDGGDDGDDVIAAQRSVPRILGGAPLSENLIPQQSVPPPQLIDLPRQRNSSHPIARAAKYNLRTNPRPNPKFQ